MYTWDLARIKENLDETSTASLEFYNKQLELYKKAIRTFVTNIDETEKVDAFDEAIILQGVMSNLLALHDFKRINRELYEKTKSAKQIKTSIKTTIDHNFDLDEVFDISKSFLDSISKRFGLQLELMKMDERVALNKSIKCNGSFYYCDMILNSLVGVNARNKEEMVLCLTHELGHSIKSYETNNDFGETIPILLELYLNDFIRENKINYDTIPYLNGRFVIERNANIEILKQYLKVNVDDIKESDVNIFAKKYYINKDRYLHSIIRVLDYFLSTEIALDLYKKGEDKLQTIEELFRKERNVFNVFDLAKITSPDVIDNEKTIKRLLRK